LWNWETDPNFGILELGNWEMAFRSNSQINATSCQSEMQGIEEISQFPNTKISSEQLLNFKNFSLTGKL
jgi:hypothetical protein